MRSALAGRIIQRINSLRNFFTVLLLIACCFATYFLFTEFCNFVIPFFILGVQKKIDDFISNVNGDGNHTKENYVSDGALGCGGNHTLKGDSTFNGNRPQSKIDNEYLKDFALKSLIPELDNVEHLNKDGGLRVAAYVRVSTKRQAREGASLEAQQEELRKLAKSMGASVIYWFIDAKSGTTFSGRKLSSILNLAENGMIDKLLVCDVDRIGRETCTLLGFILALRGLGVTTVTHSQEIDVKKFEGMMLASLKAWKAEYDNEKRTHDSLRSRVHNFKNGKWNLPVPVGYRKKNDWIEKIAEYDPVIKETFNYFMIVKNYGKVERYINKKYERILSRPLSRRTIARMLQNPVYIGKPICGGIKTRKFIQDVQVEDKNLAFIDEGTFAEVQKIIRNKKEAYERKENAAELFIKNLGDEVLSIFEERIAFLCPRCEQLMTENGATYRCPKCGYQRKKIKKSEVIKIAEWIIKREKILEAFRKMLEKVQNPENIIDMFKKNGLSLDWFN